MYPHTHTATSIHGRLFAIDDNPKYAKTANAIVFLRVIWRAKICENFWQIEKTFEQMFN